MAVASRAAATLLLLLLVQLASPAPLVQARAHLPGDRASSEKASSVRLVPFAYFLASDIGKMLLCLTGSLPKARVPSFVRAAFAPRA